MLLSIPWAQTLLTLLSILDTHPIATIFTILLTVFTLALLIDHCLAPKEIPYIFSIPGELPFIGHLHLILDNPALIYLTWCKLYNSSVFQIRIGNKRVVVVNEFSDVVALWVNHSCQNNSRPLSYTFHGLVSAFQGFTVGSTPASATFLRKKKTISLCLRKREVEEKVDLIDEEICCMVKEMVRRKDIGNVDVNFLPYLQKFTLKTAIKMSYGILLDCYNKDAKLCQEIIDVESNIIRLRSPISNLQDSVPFLRFIPWFNNREFAIRCGNRRNKYMDQLHKTLLDGITDNDPAMTNSILGRLILSNNDTTKLTPQEIQSICLTLHIQDKAIHEILSHSPHGDLVTAWNQANDESRDCKYVQALVLETLRHFTVLPLSLPRLTTKPIYYKDFMIPRDTHLFMNAYAANHDETVFGNPFRFDPERWLDKETNEIRSQGTFPVGMNHIGGSGGSRGTGNVQNFHFAFGAGSRMCSGYNLVMKEMYMMVIKMLLLFEVMPPGREAVVEMTSD
ncbi:Phenylacetate 2-hydroxylase [Candida viswanathii]|uniref:Phenylacetate 2-hydroxylase n=1 Tax=Candida viswanathii TaxID=5486 RepID=A0A367XSM6_9ASCO|nr:Phenylacetate 2-hydroxylase [Candida viswanathii]